MDTCISTAESLCCPSEIITLLISYNPIQNKMFKKLKQLFLTSLENASFKIKVIKQNKTLKKQYFSNLDCNKKKSSWEPPELHGDQTNQSLRKSILNIHWKDWCWSWSSNTSWCEELTHEKEPDAWKHWRQKEEEVTEDGLVR